MADKTQRIYDNSSKTEFDVKWSDNGDSTYSECVKDAGPSWTSAHGIAGVPFTSTDQHVAAANVTSEPATGKKLVITDLFISVDTTMNITFKEETSGTVIAGPLYILANTIIQLTPRSKAWKLPTADKALQVIASVAGKISVDAHYFSE